MSASDAPILEARGLVKRFGQVVALAGADFDLYPGEIVAIIGDNGAGILAVEYASGRLLRRVVGRAPWDYGDARLAVDGLVRLDYLPLWAAFGLGLERLHDLLTGRRPRDAARARARARCAWRRS